MSKSFKNPFVIAGGVLVYVSATAVAYLTFYDPKNGENVVEALTNEERRIVFNSNANKYDKDVDFDETITGISLMRRFLLKSTKGKVLEIAAGTGRNLPYYPDHVQLTLTDFSEGMLEQIPQDAKKRFDACDSQVMSADALCFENESFDMVVDTFGMCSMEDSVKALKEMQRVCKKDGKILLLEHGRSHYEWLSSILDKFAGLHAKRWGCHWNRDILKLVKEAGLEIESMHSFHFGTTFYIIAKPSSNTSS